MIIPSAWVNFIHVPKAAGTSIGRALGRTFTLTEEDRKLASKFKEFASEQGWMFPMHAPARMREAFLGEALYQQYFSFGFVRNPYDQLVSLYEYTRQTEVELFAKNGWTLGSFQKDILNHDFRSWVINCDTGLPQSDYLFSAKGRLQVDFIGHTENLDRDIGKLTRVLGVSLQAEKTKVNSTEHSDYQNYYDSMTRKCVEQRYETDLRLFGYSFD